MEDMPNNIEQEWNPVQTIHVQTGPEVYIFETDEILPNTQATFERVYGMKELAGTAQGEGIETVWWDTTNYPIDRSDPYALKMKAGTVRRALGLKVGQAPVMPEGTKEVKKLIVKVDKKRKQ